MNLIINARDAMPDGGTITVAADNRTHRRGQWAGPDRGDYVVLAVADSGAAFPPRLLEQVMEPFFTTKEVGKGTGLGLSMVYGFASNRAAPPHRTAGSARAPASRSGCRAASRARPRAARRRRRGQGGGRGAAAAHPAGRRS